VKARLIVIAATLAVIAGKFLPLGMHDGGF
jgi:hypothetical protein